MLLQSSTIERQTGSWRPWRGWRWRPGTWSGDPSPVDAPQGIGRAGGPVAGARRSKLPGPQSCTLSAWRFLTQSVARLRKRPRCSASLALMALAICFGSAITATRRCGCSASDLEANLRTLDEVGLPLLDVGTSVNVDPNARPYDPRLVEAIGKLKGRPLTISVMLKGLPPGDERGEKPAVKVLRQLGDLAADNGLRISVYHHDGSTGRRASSHACEW